MARLFIPILFLFIILFYAQKPVYSQEIFCQNHLTSEDIERVKAGKNLLSEVDSKSLKETLDTFELQSCPQINAFIIEAMAKTYTDIVNEQKIEEKNRKEWLYSKIQLNMAYLQLTGGQQKGDSDPLNRLIRTKLKQFLPQNILTHPAFFHEVKELLQ